MRSGRPRRGAVLTKARRFHTQDKRVLRALLLIHARVRVERGELPAAADEKNTSADAERARLAARVLLGERAALEACVSVWQKAAAAA